MPFKKTGMTRRKPTGRRRMYRRFRRKTPFNKHMPSTYFNIVRWSKVDTGIFRVADQPTPGGPIVDEWPSDVNNNLVMRFIFKKFALDDLPNVAEFTNLFNWYAIHGVKVCVNFTFDDATGSDFTSPPPVPTPPGLYAYRPAQNFKVCSFIDKTDRIDWDTTSTTPPIVNTEEQAKQYTSYREHTSFNKSFKRMVHPKGLAVVEVNEGGTIATGGQLKLKWLSTRNIGTPHYGFVVGIRPVFPNVFNVSNKWRVGYSLDCQYRICFKGTR